MSTRYNYAWIRLKGIKNTETKFRAHKIFIDLSEYIKIDTDKLIAECKTFVNDKFDLIENEQIKIYLHFKTIEKISKFEFEHHSEADVYEINSLSKGK